MKIDEILKTESGVHIHLHKEGLFWRAYEYSAYLFVMHIAAFQVKKVFVKSVSREIVSIGFPVDTLAKHQPKLTILEQNDKYLIAKALDTEREHSFEEWKAGIKLKETKLTHSSSNASGLDEAEQLILEELKCFDISSTTPVEALVFVQQLQQRLRKSESKIG